MLEVDPRDHVRVRSSNSLVSVGSVLFILCFAAVAGVAFFGTDLKAGLELIGLAHRPDYALAYRLLHVSPLPADEEAQPSIGRELTRLERDPCLGQAATALGEAADKAGEIRWAAEALAGWSASCEPDNAPQRRRAADLFIQLHDYARAELIVHGLIDQHPGVSDYWYLQGKAEAGLGEPDAALLSYANVIHLSGAPARIGQWVFTGMSDIYAAEHRFCEAMGPIQDYVSIDPGNRAEKMRELLQLYAKDGHCSAFASGSASFPVGGANVIRAQVLINNIPGTFVVDTGASFVTVDAAFAAKAHLAVAQQPRARSETANGGVYARLGTAATIKVGSAVARQVPVAILDKPIGGVDGLLGRSFLSRFDVVIDERRWTLRPRDEEPGRAAGAR